MYNLNCIIDYDSARYMKIDDEIQLCLGTQSRSI